MVKPVSAATMPQYCEIGKHTYGVPDVINCHEGAKLYVGDYCSIAPGTTVMLGCDHRPDWVTTFPFAALWSKKPIEGYPRTRGDVHIGNDVWTGYESFIMSGVTIGDGAVIGAHAVVVQDVKPYAIVFGNPATVLRVRFVKEQIDRLLRIQWWNWPEAKVRKFMPLMLSNDIDKFLNEAEAST